MTDCIFSGNTAYGGGGGMYNNRGSPTVTNCIFSGNNSDLGGGGGIKSKEHSTLIVTNCIFSGNFVPYSLGSGMLNTESVSNIKNCIFGGNYSMYGGGMYNLGTSSTVTNCTFSGNVANAYGDGIYNTDYNYITLTNSILWGDGTDEIYSENSIVNVTYSNVQNEGYSGNGNMDVNPLFEGYPAHSGDNWTGVNYETDTLQTVLTDDTPPWTGDLSGMFVRPDTADPRWFYIEENTATEIRIWGDMVTQLDLNGNEAYEIYDLSLSSTSPCIDSADDEKAPLKDIDDKGRVDIPDAGVADTLADMGAYEYRD